MIWSVHFHGKVIWRYIEIVAHNCQGREQETARTSVHHASGLEPGVDSVGGQGPSGLSEATQESWPQEAPAVAAFATELFTGRNRHPGPREHGEGYPGPQKWWYSSTLHTLSFLLGLISREPLALTRSLPDVVCEARSTNCTFWHPLFPFCLPVPLRVAQGSWCGKCSAWGSSPMTCMTTLRWSWRSPRATDSTGPNWHPTPSTRSCTAAGTRQVHLVGALEGASGAAREAAQDTTGQGIYEGKHLLHSNYNGPEPLPSSVCNWKPAT